MTGLKTGGYVMEKFVSFDKMSKKAKRQENSKKRNTWGVICPVTKVVESKKAFNKKAERRLSNKISKEYGC